MIEPGGERNKLKEVRGSSAPQGREAVNGSLLSSVCLRVYLLYITVLFGACVFVSVGVYVCLGGWWFWNAAIPLSLMARNHSRPLSARPCPPSHIQCCISITLLLPYIQSSNYIAVNLTQAILLRLMVAIVYKSEHTHFLK